ncbi:MAG: LysR family transcriptional regulator [Lentihominibacter sp.]
MNNRQLNLFLKLYEGKSMSALAEELFISQQGLSASLLKFEKELGIDLFKRTSKGLVPNSNAELVRPYLVQMKDAYDSMMHEISNQKTYEKYSISIEVNKMLLDYFPHGTEDKMIENLPNVRSSIVDVDERTAMKHVLGNEIDLAMVSGPVDDNLFDRKVLRTFGYAVVVNRQANPFGSRNIRLKDLEYCKLIIESDKSNVYNNFVNACRKKNFEPSFSFLTSNAYHMIFLVSENEGIGITPSFYTELFASEKIEVLPIIDDDLKWTIELISKKNMNIGKGSQLWRDSFIELVR